MAHQLLSQLSRRPGPIVAAICICIIFFLSLSLLSDTNQIGRLAEKAKDLLPTGNSGAPLSSGSGSPPPPPPPPAGNSGLPPDSIASKPDTNTAAGDPLYDVYNATLGFQKIFVIALPSRSDRRDGMVLQAGLSNIHIDLFDGVIGSEISDKAIPTSQETADKRPNPAELGCWRSHMEVAQKIVRENITSALILEDDADWDIRLKDQLLNYALSVRALTQPLASNPKKYADPTYPNPPSSAADRIPDIHLGKLPETVPPKISPYGDSWDMLWIGNCAMQFPEKGKTPKTPRLRVVWDNDNTAAQKKHLQNWGHDMLVGEYPDHTRVIAHAAGGVCSQGYALSQHGAQALLHEVALKAVGEPYDLAMETYCEGRGNRPGRNCIGAAPAFFQHHRPAGRTAAESDISSHGDAFRDKPWTSEIRWSVRMNTDVILSGSTDYVDGYPDQ